MIPIVRYGCALWLCVAGLGAAVAASNAGAPAESLNLAECIDLALRQNPAVLKAREEIRRSQGLIIETRAEALPRLQAVGEYREIDEGFIDVFPGSPGISKNQQRPWSATIEVTQLVYAGGRVNAALRAARLTDELALLDFERVVADTVLDVRRTFYNILLNVELIGVREQSLELLEQQLADARHRFEVGAVPQFNVLRAEVELANAKPPLIRARNTLRLAKENLVKLLGIDAAAEVREFTALQFVGALETALEEVALREALTVALERRPEARQAEKRARLREQNVRVARAGYLPEVSLFASYGIKDSLFGDNLDETIDGWAAGARARWHIFDGLATRGRLQQARAEAAIAEIDVADTRRAIEVEVRQAYSEYQQALELIAAQARTVEQGEEGLRLAEARFRAGSGTQLDVFSAQTALTESRSNKALAWRDYQIARAELERATGATVRPAD